MALTFSTSRYYATGVIPSWPFTFAGWFYTSDVFNANAIVSRTDVSAATTYETLYAAGNVSDSVLAYSRPTGIYSGKGTYSASTWHHGMAVFASATSRTAYLDGTAGGEDTATAGTSSLNLCDTVSIGYERVSSNQNHFPGELADIACWNVALDAADAAALAAGVSPLLVRPDALISYWPLRSLDTATLDVIGNNHLTEDAAASATSNAPPLLVAPNYKITSQVSRYAYNGPLIQQFRPQTNVPPSSDLATKDSYAAQTGQRNVLDFDGSAQDESASWQFQMPSWYDGSGLMVETLTSMDGTDGDPARLLVSVEHVDDDTEAS